jgi:hypothetical protein
MGDAVIAAFFAEDKPKARERKRAEVESWVAGASETGWDKIGAIAKSLEQGTHPLTPFHWEIEFPEVFARDNGGFDAIVGNPPFAGKNTISLSCRTNYPAWLQTIHDGAHGNSDLVAHFFRRAFRLLAWRGTVGFIATNTVGQGDTRETGLTTILRNGGVISRTVRRLRWPGEAAVIVSVVHVAKGPVKFPILDGRGVQRISAYLVEGELDSTPALLVANSGRAFQGSVILGIGFTFDDQAAAKGTACSLADMEHLVQLTPKNGERIFPYLGGEEVNSHPKHMHRRYVINFGDLSEEEARRGWPDLFHVLEMRVKPQRLRDNREAYRNNWWRHAERRSKLYARLAKFPHVLVRALTSSHFPTFTFLPTGMIFDQSLLIFMFQTHAPQTCLTARIHEVWAMRFGSTMKDDPRYNLAVCFETFPFPLNFGTSPVLEAAGRAYHEHRASLMVTRNEGMTKTYNRFHDRSETAEDIQHLRELHTAMDHAVLEAYGWRDLAARTAPIFLDETNEDDHTYQGRLFWPSDFRDEVLARLLALNAERHAEELRLGIAPMMKGKAKDEDEPQAE